MVLKRGALQASEGIRPDEAIMFVHKLKEKGISYLSITAGTYDTFNLPVNVEKDKKEGFMVEYAEIIKKHIENVLIVTAGRIQRPEYA